MGGSRVQVNKQHKSRFASKSSRNVHKISSKDKAKPVRPDRNAIKGARAARLQRNKMAREQKKAAFLKEKREGSKAPPRVIVLFGLSASLDLCSLEQDILTLLSGEGTSAFPAVASSEFKLRATVLKAPHGDLLACMEMAKVADLIAFVASASASCDEDCLYIDPFGYNCLSVFRAIGLPSTAVLIRDLPSELKRKQDLKKSCITSLSSEFPEGCKFYPADTRDELHKFMWLFKEQRLTSPHWRNQRPYVMAQKVDFVADDSTSDKCTLLLTGYVRAQSLSINQLVHVSGVGDFQFSKIEVLKDPCCLNARKGDDLMESDDPTDTQVVSCLTPDPLKQDPLIIENIPDPLAGEQTWPTEAEMAEAERDHKDKKKKPKTLPQGTSDYQAAWIVNDSESEYSETEEEEDDSMVLDNGEDVSSNQREKKDEFGVDEDQCSISINSDGETDTESVLMESEKLSAEQIEEDIKKMKAAHAEDEEFPDEVDTPLDVPARKRFAKYRGLKSFRTSSWDPKESLPPEYARIFAFDNFNRTQKHVLSKAQETDRTESIETGSYARLHINNVPLSSARKLSILAKTTPIISCGLLQHESKMSVLHFSVKKHESYSDPIKSKDELLFHVGFRQFVARPIFSSDNLTSDKHKMERFLHAGRFSIASIYAPISFPPLPLVALKMNGQGVAAVGSLRCIDPDRIILKKIILTGYPLKVSKVKASVRYMFHSPEDVRWFKPVEVWTKCGRRGRIKEPLGTHGAMKCMFNGVLQQHDTVCMSLFKRAYPTWPTNCYPLQLAAQP